METRIFIISQYEELLSHAYYRDPYFDFMYFDEQLFVSVQLIDFMYFGDMHKLNFY